MKNLKLLVVFSFVFCFFSLAAYSSECADFSVSCNSGLISNSNAEGGGGMMTVIFAEFPGRVSSTYNSNTAFVFNTDSESRTLKVVNELSSDLTIIYSGKNIPVKRESVVFIQISKGSEVVVRTARSEPFFMEHLK